MLGKFCLGNRCLDVFKRWRKQSQLLWEQITFLFAISRTWDKLGCEEQGMRKNHKKIISYHFCKSLPVKAEHWNAIKNYSFCPLCPQGLGGLIVCLYSDSTESIISVDPTTSRVKCLQQGLCQTLFMCTLEQWEDHEGSWAPSSHTDKIVQFNGIPSALPF